MNIIPPIGTQGLWTLIAPFDKLLKSGIAYSLIAVRQMSDIIAAGDNPETEYYTPNALPNTTYLTDLKNKVVILSLQGSNSTIYYVPSSYVLNYPDIGGVPYRVYGLTINIGALPVGTSLTNVISKINSDISELIGVSAITKVVAISPINMLTSVNAAATEAARQANIQTTITDYTRYVQASQQLANAQQKIQMLESMIIELKAGGITLPIVPNV